ncbi:MAG: hypothetical protein KDA86_03440 [Planctomycetaceae bacterium]|nr:hypothetical protein [Planctomycetaceae bacterium]
MDLNRQLRSSKSEAKQSAAISRIVKGALKTGGPDAEDPIGLLGWMSVLAELSSQLEDELLVNLWRRTLDASILCSQRHGTDKEELIDRLLLVRGEIPWRGGLLFADVRHAGQMRKAGRSYLRNELEALTDGDGTPHARTLHRLPLTLAAFVRSADAGEKSGKSLWDAESAERFEQLIERVAAMCLDDGRTALSNGASFAPASLMKTASSLAGLGKQVPAAQRVHAFPDDSLMSSRVKDARGRLRKKMPRFDEENSPSSQSDWAGLACLRNNWLSGSDCCVVTHHQAQPQVCLTAFERPLLDGDWQTTIELDGNVVATGDGWDCVCWFSDKDVDYLELQSEGEGITTFRQVLLSRTDHWLLLTEGFLAKEQGDYRLSSRIPFADGVSVDACQWTRQMTLSRGKLAAQVYPLALDQQRVNNAHGTLSNENGCLTLHQTMKGKAIYAPLVIDWSPDRRRRESQWRQLTVVEEGKVLRPDEACGFRLRVGKHQWLIYRSLQPGETARTVLGHHTPHETVIAEFATSGEVEPLVMVE